MCTNITWNNKTNFIGRNMDLGYDFDKKIVITPQNFKLSFLEVDPIYNRYSMIGTAIIVNNFPLYCEAFNEAGLYIAGLNFPNNTKYYDIVNSKNNISINELIPWVLCQCSSISEVKELLDKTNVISKPIADGLSIPELHFTISDNDSSLVVEFTKDGMYIFDNKTGVMTNNPSFEKHLLNLDNYLHLSPLNPKERIKPTNFCTGLGAVGLPGDYSSKSRFVKSNYLKKHSTANSDYESVLQMFHILDNVAMIRGSVIDQHSKLDITIYSCCSDIKNLIYYFKTYNSSRIQAVKLNVAYDSNNLIYYDHKDDTAINYLN